MDTANSIALTKKCQICKKEKQIAQFWRRSSAGGIDAYCTDCRKERNRQWREKRKTGETKPEKCPYRIICKSCKKLRNRTSFHNKIDGKYGKDYYCKKCRYKKEKESVKRTSRQNSTKNRFLNWKCSIKLLYKLTPEEYFEVLKKQGGGCGICASQVNILNPKKMFLAIDHCHKTGKIRGILCDRCNMLIGSVKDSTAILEKSIEYLRMAAAYPLGDDEDELPDGQQQTA